MNPREIGWDGMDWMDPTQDSDKWRALVNMVMDLRFPRNFGKFFSSFTIGGFSKMAELHLVS
jgi:hypothetical protein